MEYKFLIGKNNDKDIGIIDMDAIEKLALEHTQDRVELGLTMSEHLGKWRNETNWITPMRVLLTTNLENYHPFKQQLSEHGYEVIDLINKQMAIA